MNPKVFDHLTQPHLKWNRWCQRWVIKPQAKPCTHCGLLVEDQRIDCDACSLKTNPHFKHKCTVCKEILFDGSKKRQKYMDVKAKL